MTQDGPVSGSVLGRETGTALTVGTFNGVHRGHWRVLEVLRAAAARLEIPSVVVTFDPHPLAVVRPASAPRLLCTPAEKIEVLAESGVTYLVILRFDRELANYPPERFFNEILVRRFGMRHLVIGHDHGFGRDRSGDVDTLRRMCEATGIGVEVVSAVADGASAVSSSRIRAALEQGDVLAAAQGLGRPYGLRARVVRGDGRGRGLGFPTANLRAPVEAKLLPMPGIYAARTQLDGRALDGVMHIGPRPTFPGASSTVELHIFDFDEPLYGRELAVTFCARLRDVQRFEDEAALIQAMAGDCEAARAVLAAGAGACGKR